MTFYTSDTHFNHVNIIEFCGRPFRKADGQIDVDGMNEAIITNWNAVVQPSDTVYHLGDFGMGTWTEWAGFRKRLNGRIVLVKGNHDRKLESWMLPGDEAHDFIFENGLYMAHVPPNHELYEKRDRKGHDLPVAHPLPEGTKLMLCGHVHESWKMMMHGNIPVINVGVDVQGYSPKTLAQLTKDCYGSLVR